MRKLRIIIPIAIGVVAIAIISFNFALAQEPEKGTSNASRLATKVAEILGLNAAELDDAINQARRELRDEAVSAKPYPLEDIGRRLRTDIENGAITREQLAAKLKARRTGKDVNHTKFFSENIWRKLRAAVANDDITREQAAAKLEALKTGKDVNGKPFSLEALERKLKAAVDSGDMKLEEAEAKLDALREHKK